MDDAVRQFLRMPYARVFQAEAQGYSAEILEWPGCFAEGETIAEANAALERVAECWLTSMLENDGPSVVPPPFASLSRSGTVRDYLRGAGWRDPTARRSRTTRHTDGTAG